MGVDWSSTPVRVGGFMLAAASGALLSQVFDSVVLTVGLAILGFLLIVAGTWWWKRGFRFPESLEPRIVIVKESPQLVWGIDLDFVNLGRTDEFDVRIVNILGVKAPTGAIGTYPKWRGHASGDKKLVRRGDRATIALCTWEPTTLASTSEVEFEPVFSTVHASTGDARVQLTGAGANYDKLERHELVYQLRVASDATEEQVRYDVHVGVQSSSDYSPRVHVARQED